MTTTTEVRIAPYQFKELLNALTSDSAKLAIIVENANEESVARVRGDHENRAMLEYFGAELRTMGESLDSMAAYIAHLEGDAGEGLTARLDALEEAVKSVKAIQNMLMSNDAMARYEINQLKKSEGEA